MIKLQRVYQYEDDEGTWFEETVPLSEADLMQYGIVYKGNKWVEVEEFEDEDEWGLLVE